MIIMPNELEKKNERITRIKKIGLILGGIFLIYVIVGFLVVPPLLKPNVEKQLSNLLGRKVTIERIKLNPLFLSSTTSNLTVYETDGEPFAGFEELFVNTQLSSIFKWAFTVRDIRVHKPFGVLRLLPGNKLNISDILAKFSKPDPKPEEKSGLPRAIVGILEVVDGKATIENLLEKEPISETLSPITFKLENLSTLENQEGTYHFFGVGPLDSQFQLNGTLTLDPARVQGSFSTKATQLSPIWEHIKKQVSFQILKGTVDTSGDYMVAIIDGQLEATLEKGTFDLTEFELVEKGKKDVLISIPTFTVHEIGADLQAREAIVGTIQTADGKIRTWLAPDGTFELQYLFLENLEKLKAQKATDKKETELSPGPPWQLLLKKMEVDNWGLAFEDRTLTKPAGMSVDQINMVLENFSNKKESQGTVDVTMQINRAGNVSVTGTAGINPIQADMKVSTKKIALKPFQPYVDDAINAQIVKGSTSSSGRVRYLHTDAKPQIRYEGYVSVDEVEIQDTAETKNFFTLAQLKASGIALDLVPNKLYITDVLIDRPHAGVTIDHNGMVNVVNAFSPAEKKEEKEDGEQNLLQRLVNFLIMQFKGPMPVKVDRVQLMKFTGDFVDDSISPSYSTHVELKKGTVKGLSSDPYTLADFKIEGTIDQTATIEGTGQMNPMNALKYSRVNFSLKDFQLQPASPYSGKFIGFKIDKGSLHTELKYTVEENHVNGNNIIRIDHLELGEKVDSPDALNLPIKLGVTLLKDSKGRISVQVPVKGDVKNPSFDIGTALTSALTGTIKQAGEAPFSAITEIDGFTGEELRMISFESGSSKLQAHEVQKLNALAKFLKEKTSLTLGIMGTADRNMDGAAIAGENSGKKPPEDKKASEKKSREDTAAVQGVDIEQLKQLAKARVEKVRTYLIEQALLEDGRINRKPIQIKNASESEGVPVELFLSVE